MKINISIFHNFTISLIIYIHCIFHSHINPEPILLNWSATSLGIKPMCARVLSITILLLHKFRTVFSWRRRSLLQRHNLPSIDLEITRIHYDESVNICTSNGKPTSKRFTITCKIPFSSAILFDRISPRMFSAA